MKKNNTLTKILPIADQFKFSLKLSAVLVFYM